tara:strand:- start:29956 stop:30696 length:741 start_codon:yes stop_codon:yes gene_type:complete
MNKLKKQNTELLITTISKMLEGLNHVAVGASSPIPGAAALLASEKGHGLPKVTILGSQKLNHFTDGGKELFDCAAQGRIDAFFLGGGQIDGLANINLVGLGKYPNLFRCFPGSYGSSYLYFLIPRVILFREEHSNRVFVPKVDFISAPGISGKNIYRKGGPYALVTSRCVFKWNIHYKCFVLESLHPSETIEGIKANTGFNFCINKDVKSTLLPTQHEIDLIYGSVGHQIADTYPDFATKQLGLKF